MTVSRAINNHPLINAETRARVLEVARRLNYQPNQHARALATNRSHLIGVVVPDLMHSRAQPLPPVIITTLSAYRDRIRLTRTHTHL